MTIIILGKAGAKTQVGNNSAKEDYLNDIMTIIETSTAIGNINDFSDIDAAIDLFRNLVTELNVKTPEGKKFKEDLQAMVKSLELMLADPEDTSKLMQAYTEIMNLSDKMNSDIEDLIEAAENAGVTDSDFPDMDMYMY